MKNLVFRFWLSSALILFGFGAQQVLAVSSADFAGVPPTLGDSSDPFVMINLSVELTQQAEAYTDGQQTYVGGTYCPGHVSSRGVCYFETETYLGYFDPLKCYVYDTSGADATATQLATGAQNTLTPHHFKPNSLANNDFTCSGGTEFSGNFMNWATMTALDEFRMVMTGGARLVDTAGASAKTLMTRTHRYGDWGFREKQISSATSGGYDISRDGVDFVNSPSELTAHNTIGLRIKNNNGNNGNRVSFYDQDDNFLAEYNVIVEACDTSVSLDSNCIAYTDGTNTWYKPEGQMQQHALNMRFALMTYTGRDGNGIDGGVLRSNAKYIGTLRPAVTGGLETNPNAEVDDSGLFTNNSDGATLTAGVNNSGVMNYINSFGLSAGRYKSNDPVSELYYEGLRYFMNLGNTPAYSNGLSDVEKDNFPVLTTWDDPIVSECQANFTIAVGDQFSHADNNVPGVTLGGASLAVHDGIDAKTSTDDVGLLESGTGGLGNVSRGRTNSGYWIAGMAYWARTNDIRSEDANGDTVEDLPGDQTIKTFTVDTQEYNGNPPTGASNQFWLAAKYGGFNDQNGDDDPGNGTVGANTSEWDEDGDGTPDSYTLSSQPANLQEGLSRAFNEIAERVSAGSAAAVVANANSGSGAVYQALYKPKQSDSSGRQVQWVGLVRALLIDEYSNFREDTDGDGVITNADYIVTLAYDPVQGKSVVERFVTADGGQTGVHSGLASTDVDDLKALWDARDELADVADVTTQRSYSSLASTGRYIVTGIDANNDDRVVASEMLAFDDQVFVNASAATGATANNFRMLGLNTASGDRAENIVNFVRGEDISGYRSRQVDFDSDGVAETWRLGDIIHSSPVAVGRPAELYNVRYDDDTYANFVNQYSDRRQVIYTGANDGMLHAFNGGFFDQTTSEFSVTGKNGETEHPLGSELWAYVPFNLLPHVRWLTEAGYPHVYYVDGIPQSFDVNIFSEDSDHPDGWGTILVVGMRLGGGEITLDPDSDIDADTSDDITTRSAFLIFDITNPEHEPKLLAEFETAGMGYTTMRPTVIKNRAPDASGSFNNAFTNQWYLMLGSGPAGSDALRKLAALESGLSDQAANFYAFDLNTLDFVIPDAVNAPGVAAIPVPESATGFVGDFSHADWDGDFTDDVVYFGTMENTVGTPEGLLKRFRPGTNFSISTGTFSNLLTQTGGLDQPVMAAPLPYTDITETDWLYVGTGRFWVGDDNLSSEQQSYYGIKEPVDSDGAFTWATVDRSDLVRTTGLRVYQDGSLTTSVGAQPVPLNIGGSASSFTELQEVIRGEAGWYFDFDDPAGRHLGLSSISKVSVVFTEYTPSGSECEAEGQTLLNAVHFATGTAAPFSALELGTDTFNVADNFESLRSIDFGHGLVRDVVMVGNRVIGQDSTGGLTIKEIFPPGSPNGRVSWREIPLE